MIPGHRDPGLGLFRTDAPTTSVVSVRLAKAISQRRGWVIWTFDVTTAFLSGLKTERAIYVRGPPEGLPATNGWEAVMPYELMQILKSAYGLTEAPRLWYLRAVEQIHKTELRELEMAKATFVAPDDKEVWAILCLHVDDGLLMGRPDDPRFLNLKAQLDQLFKIKERKQTPLTFLGVNMTEGEDEGIYDDMGDYIRNIKIPEMEKKPAETPLTPEEVTKYRQLTMRLRWPCQQTMPQKLYEISLLAQRVNKATYGDYQEAVKLYKSIKEEMEAGRARLFYPKMGGKPYVVSFFDASLGKEADGKSQLGSMHFLTNEDVKNGPQLAAPIEFVTSKSTRVVRSSMAAESNSMSLAVDRHLYIRILLDQMWYGPKPITSDWRKDLRFGGGLITDARSLYDHLGTTGQIPSERQTMLDLLVSKSLLEEKVYDLLPPTSSMGTCSRRR